MMLVVLLPALLTVCVCDGVMVEGQTGQSVTLPCKYNINKHGALYVCWGRGKVPNSGCSEELIRTDGHKVTGSASNRYQLLGQIDEGDVSMTIHNVTEADAGQYGCRAEVPGWFNDQKHQVDLVVVRAPHTTTWAPSAPPPETTAATQTAGHMTSSETLRTSRSNSVSSAEDSSTVTVVLLCVLLGVPALLTIAGLFIIVRRRRNLNKMPQQQVSSSVMFTSSTQHLHRRESAVDNIYQIDGDGDGGGVDYEYLP